MADIAMAGLESAARSVPAPAGTRPDRFPCFDGLRAIAASAVLLTHVAFVSRLNKMNPLGPYFARMDIGVSVFFLISGFLLYRPFVVAQLEGRPSPAARP